MPVEYVMFLVLLVAVVVAIIVNALNKKAGETADMVNWANVKEPLFYEQPDPSKPAGIATVELYENALLMLEKHGNKHIAHTKSDAKDNVFLWVWGADGENTATDFDRWKFANVQRRSDILEAFRAMKARNAAQAGRPQDAAKVFAGAGFDGVPNTKN